MKIATNTEPYQAKYPVATLPLYIFRIDYTIYAHGKDTRHWCIAKIKSSQPYLTESEYQEWLAERLAYAKKEYDAYNVYVAINNITVLISEE
ncbi:MAG: hypothetical protein ACKO96_04890 [Flammeovirgaceae bacterium]